MPRCRLPARSRAEWLARVLLAPSPRLVRRRARQAQAGATRLIPARVLPMAGSFTRCRAAAGQAGALDPVLAVFVVWVIAMVVCFKALTGGAPFGGRTATSVHLFTWIPAGTFVVDVGFFVDALTACLLIVVTTIGLLVHVYSIGYMSHDPGYWRFFAYLNLFMFSMLLLVLASSFLVVFVAWELVGLCSYLLIGFWYRKRSAALAAKKAFIVNRVGDVGFALGIMLIFVSLGHARHPDGHRAGRHARPDDRHAHRAADLRRGDGQERPVPAPRLAAGRDGGPDPGLGPHPRGDDGQRRRLPASPGPTRSSPTRPSALVVVAAIGIFTAILAASIAMTQTDIKRVLAYSTLSQLGYMFAALGVGAWTAAIFHLMTHGFFKGLLFLGSGSVIHAVHEEQDMRKMGGLSEKIPITYVTMLIGSLAIAGIPPLAGFFSKDEILGESLKNGFVLGLADRLHRRRADRVLHVPAHGPDVLGHVPRPEGGLGPDPRIARRS